MRQPAAPGRSVRRRRAARRARIHAPARQSAAGDRGTVGSTNGAPARGERRRGSYVVGARPLDYLAATQRQPVDEFALVGPLRGEPVPMVRGVSNNSLVPADAEVVIEGYFDELGYRETEGPYGEFYGYY